METLRELAIDGNKTIVTSIHQPSSQLFHMFDDLLLLAKGKVWFYPLHCFYVILYSYRVHVQVAYFGPTNKVVEYFANLGLHCTLHYNPADYICKYHYVRKCLIVLMWLCVDSFYSGGHDC